MTTLPENDTATKMRELLRLMHACYPRHLELQACPVYQSGDLTAPAWNTIYTDYQSMERHLIEHTDFAEASEYWRWEWRLLDEPEFLEALAMIDVPVMDDQPPVDWDMFAGAGDMD